MIHTRHGTQATPPTYQTMERNLLQYLQGEAVAFSGRAATALYQAYQIAQTRKSYINNPEVIVPAMMCSTAANTALIGGCTPRFADVDPRTGCITAETMQARITAQTVAVVVIHLYGQQAVNIEPIRVLCQQYDITLIEDITHALGGVYSDGTWLGSQGDLTVCSLNAPKIMTVGGGFLVARGNDYAEALTPLDRELFADLSYERRVELAISYRNLHHAFVYALRIGITTPQQVSDYFMAMRSAYDGLYLRAADTSLDVDEAWAQLPSRNAHRHAMTKIYAERLAGYDEWDLLTDYLDSGVCWRFSLLVNDPTQTVNFSEAVRRDGFHVSNLYWAVNHYFNPADEAPDADLFGRRVVNLWVDEQMTAERVHACCDSLIAHRHLLEH